MLVHEHLVWESFSGLPHLVLSHHSCSLYSEYSACHQPSLSMISELLFLLYFHFCFSLWLNLSWSWTPVPALSQPLAPSSWHKQCLCLSISWLCFCLFGGFAYPEGLSFGIQTRAVGLTRTLAVHIRKFSAQMLQCRFQSNLEQDRPRLGSTRDYE